MKILHLGKKIPFPLKDGESIAMHYLSKGLSENGCTVDLMALNTQKHRVEYKEVPQELAHYSKITKVDIDTSINAKDAFLNLFTSDSYNIVRFISESYKQVLIKELQKQDYDFVMLETLYMAPYITEIKQHSSAKVIMRSENLEHEIWNNLAQQSKNPLKSFYFGLCARRLKAFEAEVRKGYDLLLPISASDAIKYKESGFSGPSILTPAGLDLKHYTYQGAPKEKKGIKVGYIGSLDWKPNIEGLDWFFSNAWEDITKKYPDLEFHLAGRNDSGRYDKYRSEVVHIHGEVDDAKSFMIDLDVLLVPLFSGSGIRLKILEGMALGKLVMSTSKGYEGIPIINNENGFVFDDADQLMSTFDYIHENFKHLEQVCIKARQTIADNFDYSNLAKRVIVKLNSLN